MQRVVLAHTADQGFRVGIDRLFIDGPIPRVVGRERQPTVQAAVLAQVGSGRRGQGADSQPGRQNRAGNPHRFRFRLKVEGPSRRKHRR